MKQRPLLFVLFILLILSCKKKESYPLKNAIWKNESNVPYVQLEAVDSLIYSFNIIDAISLVDSILSKSKNEELKSLALTRLRELKYQYVFLFDKIDNVGIRPDVSYTGFYEKLRINRSLLSLENLHTQLRNAQFHADSIQSLIQLSVYHDEVADNVDSSHYYSLRAFLNTRNQSLNKLKYDAAIQLIKTSGYLRENTLGLAVANSIIKEESNFHKSIFYYFARLNRANIHWRMGEFQSCLDELDLGPNINISRNINILFNITRFFAYSSMENLKGIKKMMDELSEINFEGYTYPQVNPYRIIGQHLVYNGNYEEALRTLLKAKSTEEKSLFKSIAQYESILYLLSICFEQLNDFHSASEVYSKNKKSNPEIAYSVKWVLDSLETSNYISVIRFADIHFSHWKHTNNIIQLENAICLYQHADKIMQKTFKSLNESTVLKYFEYQTNMHEKLGIAYYDLYKSTNKNRWLEKSIEFLFQKNNLFLEKEYVLNKTKAFFPDDLIESKNNIQKKIKEASFRNYPVVDEFLDYYLELSKIEFKIQEIKLQKEVENVSVLNNKTLRDIMSSMDKETTLLAFHIISDEIFLIELNSDKYDIHILKTPYNLHTIIDSLYEVQSENKELLSGDYANLAYAVFNSLFPDAVYQGLRSKLIIIPDKQLNTLNFESLVTSPSQSTGDYHNLEYLIKSKSIHVIPSEQFITINSKNISSNNHKEKSIHAYSFSDVTSLQSTSSYVELLGALREVEFIEEYMRNNKSFKGKNATKINFISSLSSNIDYIHAGLHGLSNNSNRDELKLYFRTKTYNLDSLHGFELLDIDIKCSSIFLSACQSGLGKFEENEGIINLPRYFYMKGVENVVYSIWNLDDRSTTSIVKIFYTNGMDLRKAKLEYINNDKKKAHPYYWAGLLN